MTTRCQGWCGECYANGRGRSNKPGHVGYRCPRPWWRYMVGQFVKPPSKGGKDVGVVGVVQACAFARENPALFEYLTLDRWEDGSARQSATLLAFAEDGLIKLCLNDRASGRSAWAAGASWERALNALEAMLASGDVEWRVKAAGAPTGQRKKT